MSLTPGTTLGTFEITGLLGKGGMGEVYHAKDSKLGRDVAIKVLPEDFAKDPERLARFEREAQTLASLNNPNVATVYGFEHDAAQGVHYLIMEHIDGETLGERIVAATLTVSDTLPLFIDIARGLDAAHEAGIVHRDLKPDNVKINADGVVKILDFGIAKSTLETTTTDPGAPTTPMSPIAVTAEGTFMGTPVYMSPEQARGKTVDRRTDIWAYGCCLYEALTGDLPFQGETIADTVGAIMEREPDWNKLPESTPRSVLNLLQRCLEKNSKRRLSSAGDIAIALEDIIENLKRDSQSGVVISDSSKKSGFPISPIRLVVGITVIAIGVFLITRTSEDSPKDSSRDFELAAEDTRIKSIAVLPLENMSSDPEKDYFANGMTEAITGELAKIRSLKVISRSSVMRYKETELTMAQIAEELNVQALITGSVQQIDDEVTISVDLIEPTTGTSLWNTRSTETITNVLKLQSDVALAIADEIKAELSPEERTRIATSETVNRAAYDFYLRGMESLSDVSPQGLSRALFFFTESNKLDSEFAHPYVGMGRVHELMALVGVLSPIEQHTIAHQYIERATELDPQLYDARRELILAKFNLTLDWNVTSKAYLAALESNPNDARTHQIYSMYLHTRGNLEESAVQSRKASTLAPYSPIIQADFGATLVLTGHVEEGRELLENVVKSNPDDQRALIYLAFAYLASDSREGFIESAQHSVDVAGGSPLASIMLVTAYAVDGQRDRAYELLASIDEKSKSEYVSPFSLGFAYRYLGDIDKMFHYYDQAIEDPFTSFLTSLRNDYYGDLHPHLRESEEALMADPRYWALIEKAGYPPLPPEHPLHKYEQAWFASGN